MRQGLIGATFIYFQFSNIVFGSLFLINEMFRILSIISNRKNLSFGLYIDDYLGLAKIFEDMFQFLHKIYFLYIIFVEIGLFYWKKNLCI